MRTWILERYQVYGRVCVIAAVFVTPVVFNVGTADVFNLIKITALWIATIGALAMWLIWSVERGAWPPAFRLLWASALFLGACTLATIFSETPAISLLGSYQRYGGLIPFALYASFMLAIVGLYWERPDGLKELARASAAASIIMSTYVLIQVAGLDWNQWVGQGGTQAPSYPVGTMGNSNFAGGYLGITLPFLVYVAFDAQKRATKWFFVFLVGLDVLALWFTHTRGGMLAGGAGLVAMAVMYRDRLPKWVKGTIAGLAATAVAVAVLVIWHPGMDRRPGVIARAATFSTSSLVDRVDYWVVAWRIFAENPVHGTGLDTYYGNYSQYRPPSNGARTGFGIPDKPHNIYLEYAANTGALGAGSYLLVGGLGLWYGYRRARKLDPSKRLLVTSFTAVLVGYLAQGLFSIDVPALAMTGWVALGGIAAIADPKIHAKRQSLAPPEPKMQWKSKSRAKKNGNNKKNSSHEEIRTARSGPLLWPIHAGAILIALVLLAVGIRPVIADFKMRGAQKRLVDGAPILSAVIEYEGAVRLNPLEPSYRAALGELAEQLAQESQDEEERKALLTEALKRYKQAHRISPESIGYMIDLARVNATWASLIDTGRFPEANRWMAGVVRHDPTNWEAHRAYALLLLSWADVPPRDPAVRRRAAAELEEVVRIRPDQVGTWVDLAKAYRELGEEEKARVALARALKIDPNNQEAKTLLALPRDEDASPTAGS